MAERPLYTLYKNLKAQNYDVPNDYNKFESALTRDGKSGADNRHAIYENLKAQNFDVPDTYERFYSALFEPRSKTSSRAKGGSVPMSAADRARYLAGTQAVLNTVRQVKRASGNIRKTVEQAKKFNANGGKVTIGFKNPLQNQNVQKNEFNYNATTGKTGTYTTTDGVEFDNEYDATQYQNQLDKQNAAYQQAVDTGEIPSAFDVRDKNGNYDLQENIGKNGTYLTEEGAQKQFDKKLADAYARKKEIEALIAEDNRQHGNPLLSYSASIGAGNGRTAEQSDYRNKLATSLSLVTEQIGALEAVKQYPTSSWGEDALKALDNTAFTAKTWDFGLTDFATMGQMERIKTKMDNNIPLSGSDKMLLKSKLGADAAAALEDEKMGNIYRWTKIAGQSLPFMADFFLTGGYGGITKTISRGALKYAAGRGMGKVSAAILKNTGIVAGDVIGSYAMAGTEQAMKTGADIMQRHLGNLYQDENGDYKFGTFDENGNLLHEGGESMGTALYKGLTSAMVENYTEKLFGHNYGIKKGAIAAMEKHGMDGTAQFFKNIGKSGWYTNSKKWMEKFGVNGFGEEVMEEEIGIPLHALLDGDNNFSDLGDAKQQLDIIGGMAISVGSMYAVGADSRPVKGIYNRAQYYRFRNKVNVADNDAQNLLGDNWADIKDKIDNATNEQMGSVLADVLRQRDTMSKEQINAAVNYGVNLMKMRGYNIAKTAEMNAKEITNEPTTPEEQHQDDIDNAYSEGHDADDADKHDIQIQQEDQMKTLSDLLGISEQQLSGMSDDELESMTDQDDKLDQAIYDYQLSSARYQGVVDDAQDRVDLAAHQAAQKVDMYTDRSRGSVRNATIKASGGAEDYGVYIISGNIATNEDGSINVSGSDSMILYYDPTTDSVEHADALMFAELGEELPADDVKTQAVADAKENAIKEIAGIIDGTVEAGSQFTVTDADGTEHTYEVLADNGDGTAMITIDGNIPTELVKGETVQIPYPLADLQQMKDLEDQKRLEAAKAEREQMEKERAAQQTEETQPSFDFNQIINDNGNVVLVDVLDKDGNTKYPNSQLFLIRDSGAKAKVMELTSDGSLIPHAVNKKDVRTATTVSLDEYKQAFAGSSMIEGNSGENRGGIEAEPTTIEDETTPDVAENTETTAPAEENAKETEQAPATPAMTLEDGTIVPMLEDGNPDFSKLTAEQTAELYDSQFGDDADSVISSWVSEAKKALDKANNMTVKGKTFIEQKAAKDAKEKAIADAQAAYDSAIAIRDAYNERQLAKVEDTAEGRKSLIDKARRKFARLKSAVKDDAEAVSQLYRETIGSLLHRLYDSTGIDVTDTVPLTAEEYVASNLGAHSLNYEGNETSKGVKQETGLSREDFAKTQLLAADGKGATIDAFVHSLWDNRPSNLESLDTQDIRNALIDVLTSGFKASEARSYIENIRIAQAEKLLEEQELAAENAAYAEQQKAKEEEEKKKAELEKKTEEENEKINEQINENTNALTPEQQKAKEDGEKLGFPAVDKEGEPINQYVIELANWAKEQGLEIDPTSKMNSYGDLFVMCKNGFGVSTLVPDVGESINQVAYFPGNVQNFDELWKLQEEFNVGRDIQHAADMNSELTEGAIFYNGDAAREFKDFVDKKVEEQNRVFGEQLNESDLPFSAKDNGTQQTSSERAADVEKNKVDDIKVVDNIVGQKTRKTLEKLAKMMGANVQWQYSDKNANGWFDDKTNTIYLTLDSSITEGVQFIFGHEMTHEMRTKNPAAYDELKTLVKDMMGEDTFNKETDRITSLYNENNVFYNGGRTAYEEEVVADQLGKWIRDANYAHTLLLKMSHPLLARLHEIVNRFLMALRGIDISDDMNLILRSIEQAYVKTANGQVTNSETGEDVSFSLRQKPEPKKKGVGYKVFVLKDGKLYPPMVANPDGAATPVGVWLDADAAPIAGESKTGRPQVKQGGKGTQGGSGKLAYRPGWHLGVVPYAIQFNRKDAEGNKTLFPKNFVFAEVEYAADVDYQEEARQEGINPSGKYQHSLAGLKHLPTDGYYMYRTNPNPETDPWVITGAMKVNRILTRAEQAKLVKNAGREPQQIQEGDIVTDDVVNSINQEIAAAPKFSLKVYHGSGADFTEFDFDHMGEGAGSQAFGWGGYVTSSKKIGKSYAEVGQQSVQSRRSYSEDTPIEAAVGAILGQEMYNSMQAKTFEQKKAQAIKNTENSISSFSDMLKNSNELDEKSKKFLEKSIEKDKKKLEVLRTLTEEQYKEEYIKQGRAKNLYEVDIPDDNGGNYLDWDAPITDELIDKVVAALPAIRVFDIKNFKKDRSFEDLYRTISMRIVEDENRETNGVFNDDKAASKLLASLGYTGIKYKAGRNFGGAEEGDTNYVIFKPEDMRITEHTKFSLRLKSAIDETETNPSDAQKESGNYKKGHIKFGGYNYTIENPKGSTRSGKDADGKEWKVTMHDTYGYIRGKFGKDGDHLDMFINDKADLDNWNGDVFVVDQVNTDGSFDEHKVMYGYDSMSDAEKAYLANYSKGWQGLGGITGASKAEFDKWLDTSNRKLKPFADYAKVKFSQAQSVAELRYSLDDIKPVGVGAFGNIYNQFRGKAKDAIEFLKKVRGGEAVGALHHKDIGDIDLVWGKEGTGHSDGYGLSKLVKYHPEVLDNLQEILNDMRVVSSSKNRVNLESETHKAGVRLTWDGERKSWLLTAFKKETSASDKRTDTAATSLEGDTALSQTEGSAAKIDNSSETSKENGEKFSLKDEKIKSVAEKFGVNEDDVAMYANAIEKGSTAEAARARANIKRHLLQANEDKISSFKELIKYTKPVNEALKENFGDLDAMIEERRKQVEEQRNAMEAARKRAQEEEEKRQKHLEELSLIPTDELDKRYMDAIANNDESTAREMLDESARRNGYDDVDSDYQGQGAWAAPSNPQYESDEARRADIENSPDVNLEDIALGYNLQPDDYFDNPRAYMNNTAHGLESAHVIKNALDAIKNGEKDVKVKVYRAVPTSVKEGKLRNGDWVTPSKKYAEMHGDNRLDGKYRIIEDEVPANQLWWDGNDANEFGFDDGKEYRYKNAKNNRKLNDLITYDNKGNVIPPSKRFNSRKNDIRFSLAGERGAATADKAEERTFRMDNLSVAKDMEKNKKKAKAIKAATGWERGADGKWRYEMPDVILRDPKEWVNKKNLTLSDIVEKPDDLFKEYPELFDAYPELKDVKIQKGRAKMGGSYYDNTITLNLGDIREAIKYDLDIHYKIATRLLKRTLVHEVQHYIQHEEGFAKGGSQQFVRDSIKDEFEKVIKQIRGLRAEGKEDEAKALVERNKALYNAYANEKDSYKNYKSLSGEVEARNVSARLNMTPEERRKSLAESTEDVARKDQIFLGVGDVSFSLRDMADGKDNGVADMAEDLKSLNTPDEVDDAIKSAIEDMPSGWKMANKKMIHIAQALGENRKAEIAGEEPKFSLRYDQFEHDLNQWKKDNNLPKDAQRPTIPQRNAGESAVDFLRRVDEYRKQMALWKTAPTYEQHLLSDDTALGEFNRELQRGSVLKRIAFQDSMLAIRKAQEAIMKEVGVDRLNMAEDAYTAENRSHGKGKNEFEEYNNEFLQPLRKAYHQMKKVLGDSYDNVRIYMMAKHGLERDAQMAFKKSLEADYEDVAQRNAAYKAYKGDMNRMGNDSGFELGYIDFNTWRQKDDALRAQYSPSYMNYRYDKNGIAYDYSGLSAIFDGSDFEEAASKLVRDIESKHTVETLDLWDATNAATKKILRDGYKAGMMSKDTYQYVRDMYSHYIPLRGWDGTTADQVWDYIGGGKGAFNQTLKTANGRTSIADDPIAYIENMAESGILLNNKNWVKQHLMLLAQNHPTSLLTLSKAWYVKSTDANGNEEWIPATSQITSQMNSNQVKAAIDAFEQKMEQMAQTGDATQKRDGLNIAYPQTHSEEREHEVRVMKDGEEYVIYVNGDPQLAQAMNNTRAHRVREIQSGKLDRAAAWLGRKMAAAYTSMSPLFIPSNYFRDLTMTLASTAIREDGRYNYLLRKNLATSWNLGSMLMDYQNGKLREKVNSGNTTPKEQMFYDFMMNGGETGFVSSLDVEDLKKKFKNDLKDLDRWKANPVKVGHTIMDGIEFLNRAIENSNRFAIYMTSIQYGRSIDEAVNDAKDVTLNFNRKGTGEYGWQMIRNLYLFINPAVQSLQTLGALVKHHPFKFTAVTASWLASGVLVPIVNAALMSLFGGDDDKDKYWQFTKWDRRNNLIMWVPFTHEYVKIPLAQEFRAFYGVGDMIASKMMGGELAEESWNQYAEDLLGQVVDMLPLDPTGYDGNIAVSLMPNPIRPIFELAFNVDFTGKPLFKDSEYNKYDPNFTKAYVGTPDWLVRISKMVNSIGNDYPDVQQNSIDAFGNPRYSLNNPAVVDHVLSSYLGGAYTMGSQVLGVLTKSLNDPKEIKMADIPLISKFVSNPDDRPVTKKQGDEFWNMKENHDRAANTLSKLKKQAKVDGDYSMLERFYDSEEYKQYKQDDLKVKKYEEDKKKERAEESGEEYRPHKLNAEDIYKAHATPKDDFEDMKLKQLYTKLNGFKTSYDLLADTAPSQSDAYYNTNKAAIDAIDEISLDKQEISELKKGFLDDGKDAYNAEDMKQIRELRKKILVVLEKANKVVVANQKAKADK